MKINLLPLYSRLTDSSAVAGVSWHQQATWSALRDPSVDAVINMAATGDGLTLGYAFANGDISLDELKAYLS